MSQDQKSDVFIQQIQHILLHDWDPMNIRKNTSMHDEYDNYIADILDIFENEHATVTKIADCLQMIEHEHMGLTKNPARAQKVAEKVWQSFEEFLA